jgi:hypothetical protein
MKSISSHFGGKRIFFCSEIIYTKTGMHHIMADLELKSTAFCMHGQIFLKLALRRHKSITKTLCSLLSSGKCHAHWW